jgi:hypothetical protein
MSDPIDAQARRIAVVTAVAALFACAPTQRIPLDSCVTEKVVVYVDGRLLEQSPASLELRADQPHKLYFKRPGEPPHLIVLESKEGAEGAPRLEPADPCREVLAVGEGRELTVDVDPQGGAPPGGAPAP